MRSLSHIQLARCKQVLFLLALRLSAVALQILAQILLGRFLGSAGVGFFQLVNTWVSVLGECAAAGLPSRAMRVVSATSANKSPSHYSFLFRAMACILIAWLVLTMFVLSVYFYVPHFLPIDKYGYQMRFISLALFGAFSFAQMRLISEVLKAQGHVNSAVFAESAGPVLVLLFGIVLCFTFGYRDVLYLAMIYSAGIALTATLLLGVFVIPMLVKLKRIPKPKEAKIDVIVDGDLMAIAGSGMLNILFISFPFIVLPYVSTLEEIGAFSVAFKLVNLISTILIMLSAIYGPMFARAANDKDPDFLLHVLKRTQIVSCLLYLPPFLLLMVFSAEIVMLFGEEFSTAIPFIYALLLGQAVNAVTGLPGVMLNMIGAGRLEFLCAFVASAIAFAYTALMHQSMTALDVAIVFSVVLACKNIISYCCAVLCIKRMTSNESIRNHTFQLA